jgi:signal transduction histidine kinase
MQDVARRSALWIPRWGVTIVAAMIIVVLGACAAALWLVDAKGQALISDQEQDALSDEMDLISAVYRDEGRDGLMRALARRAAVQGEHQIYALREAGGVIAGNLKTWPAKLGDDEAWASVDDPERGELRVATQTLAPGIVALAGRDDDAQSTFQDTVIYAVWIAIAIVAVTCLFVATAITAFIMTRVRALSATAVRVSAGDFSARAPGADAGGPFGQIAKAQNAMLERIEDLVTGLRTVTDSLAHDLRTPLARTRRRIEQGILSDRPEAKQASLEDALAETDRTIATFTGLIDIARAEGGLSRDSMAEVDLARLVAQVHDLFEPLADERGVRFAFHTADMKISGHKALLMQAVANLVHNAIKFAPDGGKVDLDLRAYGDRAEVIVSDDGPGIAPESRANAVLRFSQLGAGDRSEGVGLGLAIVQACAHLHRGRLTLEDNAPGLRARLTLALS